MLLPGKLHGHTHIYMHIYQIYIHNICTHIWLDGMTDAMDMTLGKLRETVRDSPWGCKESDTTGQLKNNNKNPVSSVSLEKPY